MSQPAPGYVLDAFALLAYLKGESRGRRVAEVLSEAAQGRCRARICTVNWAEALYILMREHGPAGQERADGLMAQLAVGFVPADRDLAASAARLKVPGALSLADCFAAALARATDSVLLTGNPDFQKLEPEVRVEWLTEPEGEARPAT